MDLNYSPEENAFRHEVRAFLTESLPGSLRRKVLAGIYHSREEQAGVGCARRTRKRTYSSPTHNGDVDPITFLRALHVRGAHPTHQAKKYGAR